ncbi:espin-like protein [Synchiropus picturatus]
MTEEDLNRIEKQIENLQVMHKVSEVEKELEQLEQELHQLLPVSAALSQGHFSVNPKQVHGKAEDLPAWCSKISTLLKSMAILLATLGGKQIDILDLISSAYPQAEISNGGLPQSDPGGSVSNGFIGRSQSFSTREEVEKEIKQCGVSVKNLKANYEIQNHSSEKKPSKVYKRTRSLPVVCESESPPGSVGEEQNPCSSADPILALANGDTASAEGPTLKLVEEPVIVASQAPLTYTQTEIMPPSNIQEFNQVLSTDPVLNNDQLTRSLEVQTDLSYVQECIEMRKERIVFLFLEHWRKYTISESYRTKYASRRGSHLDVGWAEYDHFSGQVGVEMQSEDDKLLHFMKSKQVVGNLIGHWRTIMSQVPTRQIRRLSRAQMIYWPEHFLPHINGSPVNYESLTLDLFMLGYFQLLEMSMSRTERKFRHLLCYEMFDRLGRHKWEVIRQFHKEVMEDIERGKRDWADGFEDIKLKYFGDSDEGEGVMTASLRSVDTPIIPPETPPPPPPSHPPPPPPTQAVTELSSQEPQMDTPQPTPPAGGHNGVSEHPPLVEEKVLNESCQQAEVPNGASSDPTESTLRPTPVQKEKVVKNVPHVRFMDEPQVGLREDPNEDSIKVIYELKEFSNEEIIRYIDRSFAFWKEKEAELFDI